MVRQLAHGRFKYTSYEMQFVLGFGLVGLLCKSHALRYNLHLITQICFFYITYGVLTLTYCSGIYKLCSLPHTPSDDNVVSIMLIIEYSRRDFHITQHDLSFAASCQSRMSGL